MEHENDIPSEALPEEQDVSSSDSEETVESTQGEAKEQQAKEELEGNVITLEELNAKLGRNYKSKETALKSLRDTRQAAVAKKTDVESELIGKGYMTRDQFEDEMFFKGNEEFSKNREIIEALASKQNKRPSEVVSSETYKRLSDAQRGYEESQSVKSVLESNPRLGQSRDRISEAKEAVKAARSSADIGEQLNAYNTASSKAVDAVLGAYGN